MLFNLVNRYVIFTWKIICIGATIICGYAAIAHFHEHPVFGVMYYVIFIDLNVIYVLVYDKAFKTPESFRSTVRETLRQLGGKKLEVLEAKVLKRQFRSVPSMGIKVGEFHTMERTSTPVFLDYVLNNVVSMLVAF